MFSGNYTNVLDEKGRVAIPAKFRETLATANDDKLVVTIFEVSGIPCLEAYTTHGWQDFVASLDSKIGSFSHQRLVFESTYIGNAMPCQLDKQGRILLSQTQRKFAELEQSIVFVGALKKFRVFSAEGYDKLLGIFRTMLRENPDLFRDLGV